VFGVADHDFIWGSETQYGYFHSPLRYIRTAKCCKKHKKVNILRNVHICVSE